MCLNSISHDSAWLKDLQQSIEAHLYSKTLLQGRVLKSASAVRIAAQHATFTTNQSIEFLEFCILILKSKYS